MSRLPTPEERAQAAIEEQEHLGGSNPSEVEDITSKMDPTTDLPAKQPAENFADPAEARDPADWVDLTRPTMENLTGQPVQCPCCFAWFVAPAPVKMEGP